VSEVEGDAILFYRYGEPPPLEKVYKQVAEMFCAFHRSLLAYDHTKYCHCTACISAIDLTLKVITHYGEFTNYSVQNFHKLIGKDIIVAHQLLKNDIAQHEYWLVTNNLLQDQHPSDYTKWMKWSSSVKQTDNGQVAFHFTQLGPLKNEILPERGPQLEISDKIKMVTVAREYETDIITLLHATGDYNYRSKWQVGVKKVEEINHYLPRVGMKWRSIMDDGQVVIYSSSYFYQPDRVEFSETDEKKKASTYYLLEKTGAKKTMLTINYYIKKNKFAPISFRLLKKNKIEKNIKKSLGNLDHFVKTTTIPI
jgi:hypothetical protein